MGGLGFPLGGGLGGNVPPAFPANFQHTSLEDNVLQQFRKSLNILSFLDAFLIDAQSVQDTLFAMLTKRLPDAAVGAQVDVLGAIRNVAREGRTDAPYLVVQHAFFVARKSSGTIPDLLLTIDTLLPGATVAITDLPQDPASTFINVTLPALSPTPGSPDTTSVGLVRQVIQIARAAGVRVYFEWSPQPVSGMFLLIAGNVQVASTTQGLSDNPPVHGGSLAGLEIA